MVFSAFFSAHKVIQKNHNEQTIIKNIQVSHDGICKEFIPRNPNAWEKSPTAWEKSPSPWEFWEWAADEQRTWEQS